MPVGLCMLTAKAMAAPATRCAEKPSATCKHGATLSLCTNQEKLPNLLIYVLRACVPCASRHMRKGQRLWIVVKPATGALQPFTWFNVDVPGALYRTLLGHWPQSITGMSLGVCLLYDWPCRTVSLSDLAADENGWVSCSVAPCLTSCLLPQSCSASSQFAD